jgi:glycosyltransferase involved in cell wall biosynthesis
MLTGGIKADVSRPAIRNKYIRWSLYAWHHNFKEKHRVNRVYYLARIRSREGQAVHVSGMISAFENIGFEVIVASTAKVTSAEKKQVSSSRIRASVLGRFLYDLFSILSTLRVTVEGFGRMLVRRPSFIYERSSHFGLSGVILSKILNIPLVLEVNTIYSKGTELGGAPFFGVLAMRAEALAIKSAHVVAPVSAQLSNELVSFVSEQFNVNIEKKVIVLGNAIGRVRWEALGDLKRSQRGMSDFSEVPVIIGFLGYFRKWHRLDLCIDAIAKVRDATKVRFEVRIYGDGPIWQDLHEQVKELGLSDTVLFKGEVLGQELDRALVGMDVAIQPAATLISSPLKLLDYMAAGLAIVAPDQPNVRAMLCDGEVAALFKPGSVEDLARTIGSLLESPQRIKELGGAARNYISKADAFWETNAANVSKKIEQLKNSC